MNTQTTITIEPTGQQSTALATIDPTSLSAIFATKDGVEATLARIEREAREQATALDIDTERSRKAIKSLAHKVARSKTAMDEAGADVKAEWLAKSNAIDADRRMIRSRLDALKSEILAPVEEYEAKIAAKLKANEDAIAAMEALIVGLVGLPPADINERRTQLKIEAEFDWLPEFTAKAERIRAGIAAQLLVGLQEATQREIEAKAEAERRAEEAERQRLAAIEAQRVREEQIAREAAERARQEAEARAKREAEEAAQAAQRAAQMEDYHRRMLDHVKNCGLGFIDKQPQPIGILQRELTSKITYDAENFGDLLPEALAARDEALARIQRSVDEANRRHAEEEALQAAERREREATEALAAAERARVEAEQRAERERVEAIERERIAAERAEITRKAEIAKAEREKEEAIEAERRRVAAAAEAERVEAERRAANVAHRKKINGAALAAIMKCGADEEMARAIVTAIARGEVPHVTIGY